MAKKSGSMRRIAKKAVAAGRVHAAKVLLGEETLPEAAGGTVRGLLSSSKATSALRAAAKRESAKTKPSAKKKSAIKPNAAHKKSRIK